MSHQTPTVGYRGGDTLPQMRPLFSTKTFYDVRCLSKVMDIADLNPEILMGERLSQYCMVRFDRYGDLCETSYDEGRNGQATTLEMSVKSDTMSICQSLKFEMKFERGDLCRTGEAWNDYEDKLRMGVSRWMHKKISRFAYPKLIGGAAPENIVLNPGSPDGVWQVNAVGSPGAGQIKMSNLALMMQNALGLQNITCDPVDQFLFVPQQGYSALQVDQEALNTCCSADNSMINGHVQHTRGFSVILDNELPLAGYNANGPIYYVFVVPKKAIWLPVDICYIEWEKHLHDLYFIGDGSFGAKAADPRTIAVAKVQFK